MVGLWCQQLQVLLEPPAARSYQTAPPLPERTAPVAVLGLACRRLAQCRWLLGMLVGLNTSKGSRMPPTAS
jgi:hypothetical protein